MINFSEVVLLFNFRVMVGNILFKISIGSISNQQQFMPWQSMIVILVITCLIGAVLLVFSNIVIKAYPSLSKKTQMADIHYQEAYNRQYVKENSLINKLRQFTLWKVIVLLLILTFIIIRYFTLLNNMVTFMRI